MHANHVDHGDIGNPSSYANDTNNDVISKCNKQKTPLCR